MPGLFVQPFDDRQNRFALAAQKVAQHLVVGVAFVIRSHITLLARDESRTADGSHPRAASRARSPAAYPRYATAVVRILG